MSAAVKDIALGSVILVACVALLAIAFTAPSPLIIDEESTTVAAATTPRRPAERPTVPAAPPEPPAPVIERPAPTIPSAITMDDVRQPTVPRGPVVPTASDAPRAFDAAELTETSRPQATAVEDDDDVDEPIARRWDDAANEVPDPPASPRPDWREAAAETPAAPAASDRSKQARQHVVVSGETYQSISSQYYGTVRHWQRIQEANSADQHSLMPGMTLIIPALEDGVVARAATTADATPAAAAKGSGSTYVVRSGDSFYTIARDQLGNAQRYRELQELNNIDPYDLHVGMTIRLPASSPAPAAARPRGDAPAPAGSVVHVVERGEILGDISQRYYGTSRRWRAIADANGITDPQSLRVGQRLIIPDAAARTATVPTPSTSRPAATPTPAPARAPTTERGEGVWHEVARGDTLQLISQRYYGTTTRHPEILAANAGVNPNNLIVGSRLWIPNAPPAAAPARQPAPTPTPAPRTQPRDSGNDGGGRGPDWGSVLP